MILVLFAFTFLGGLMLGYMLFNDSPKNHTYKFKTKDKTYDLVFKTKKTEIWDDMDGPGCVTVEKKTPSPLFIESTTMQRVIRGELVTP